MQLLLKAFHSYTTNHNGQFPDSMEQLVISGGLETTNFAGNLGLNDFELVKDGSRDFQSNKIVLQLREPFPMPGAQSVLIRGAMSDTGVGGTEIVGVVP
jgi:hypothetical protein